MATDIGARISLDNEKSFRDSLKAADSQIKNLHSEMNLLVSSMDGMSDSEATASQKTELLSRTLEAHKQKVDVLSGQYDAAKNRLNQLERELISTTQEFGENSAEAIRAQNAYNKQAKSVNDLGTKLNNAQADMNRVERDMQNLGKETDKTSNSFANAGEKSLSFGDVLKANVVSGLVINGIKAVAGAVKEIAGAFKDCVVEAAAYADEILTLSTETGLTTSQLQEFQYASELVDVSLDTLTGSMAKNIKSMASARKGSQDYVKAYEQLGITVTDANGELKDSQGVFFSAIDALGKIENETERDAIAMQLFGKSAQDLNPLIAAGSDTLNELAQEAHNVGYVLDEDALSKLGAVDDAMQRLKTQTTGLKNALVLEFAPAISSALETILQLLQMLRSGDFEGIQELIKNIVNSIKTSLIDEAPALIDSGQEILGNIVNGIVEALPKIAETMGDVVASMFEFLKENYPEMVKKGEEILKNLLTGIINSIPEFVAELPKVISSFLDFILSSLPTILESGADLLASFVRGIIDNIPKLVSELPKIIKSITSTISEKLPEIIKSGFEIIINLLNGIFSGIPDLVAKLPEIITSIIDGLMEGISGIFNVGKAIIEGLWDGISSMGDWIGEKVSGLGSSIVGGFKSILGINSPSRVMRDEIGKMMGIGLAQGIESSAKDAILASQRMMDGIETNISRSIKFIGQDITSYFPQSIDVATNSNIIKAAEATVNGMALSGTTQQPITIQLQVDAKTLAEVVFDPIRSVSKQRGVAIG